MWQNTSKKNWTQNIQFQFIKQYKIYWWHILFHKYNACPPFFNLPWPTLLPSSLHENHIHPSKISSPRTIERVKKKETYHGINFPLSARVTSPKFQKGIRKKWVPGRLKEFMSPVFVWGGLTMFLVKKDFVRR